jgi:hypothetical protein
MRCYQSRRIGLLASFLIAQLSSSFVIISISASRLQAQSTEVSQPERADLRERLKQFWDSMATFEFTSDEYTIPEHGGRTDGLYLIRTRFIKGLDGRSAIKQSSIAPGGHEKIFHELRNDGVRSHGIVRLKNHDIISELVTSNAQGNELEYKGAMCYLLWILLPGGRPIYTRLDTGGDTDARMIEGRETLILNFTHKGLLVSCFLDPEHDWLPRRVEIGGEPRQEITVTRFSRVDGRWIPAEGTYTGIGPDRRGYKVTSFRVNHAVAMDAFEPPPVPDGARVFDETTSKGYFKGGPVARDRFVKKYIPAPPPSSNPSATEASLAGRFATLPGLTSLIFWSALACLGLSFALRIYNYQRMRQGCRTGVDV